MPNEQHSSSTKSMSLFTTPYPAICTWNPYLDYFRWSFCLAFSHVCHALRFMPFSFAFLWKDVGVPMPFVQRARLGAAGSHVLSEGATCSESRDWRIGIFQPLSVHLLKGLHVRPRSAVCTKNRFSVAAAWGTSWVLQLRALHVKLSGRATGGMICSSELMMRGASSLTN